MRGLSFFKRTSSGSSINIAAYHSPHSLTWRWLLNLEYQRIEFARPKAVFSRVGPHITLATGIGSVISGYAMRHNGGWQFGLTVLGVALSFSQQQPMWFRNLYYDKQMKWYRQKIA